MTSRQIVVADRLNVSRETTELLEKYAQLVLKWNPTVNLVSKTSVEHLWQRHIVDSAQIVQLAPPKFSSWMDLGSGGGFPGVVVAILTRENAECGRVQLVEADQRKAAFLRAVSRETGVEFDVTCDRIEAVEQKSSVVSARALAPLSKLLELSQPIMDRGAVALFPKGKKFQHELQQARKTWQFNCTIHQSITDDDAVVLELGDIRRA